MKRKILILVFLFIMSFFYLHLKISLSIAVYKLTHLYKLYNKLIDKRDTLLYNLAQKTNLKSLNQWAENNHFTLPEREKLIIVELRKKEKTFVDAKKKPKETTTFFGKEVFAQEE